MPTKKRPPVTPLDIRAGRSQGAPVEGARSQAERDAMRGYVQSSRHPADFAPTGAVFFSPFDQRDATVGPAATDLTGATLAIGAGFVGVIRSLAFTVNNLLASSVIAFDLLINGAGVPGFSNVRIVARPLASWDENFTPDITRIDIPENATISARVRVTDAVVYNVAVRYTGWKWTTTLAERFGRF